MTKIKFQTSSVAVERSVEQIKRNLREVGSSNFLEEWDGDDLRSLSFNDKEGRTYRLQAYTDAIKDALLAQYKKPTERSREIVNAQANRTAWKLISERVACEVQLIQLHQSEFLESFLAHAYNEVSGKRFYQLVQDNQKMLEQ